MAFDKIFNGSPVDNDVVSAASPQCPQLGVDVGNDTLWVNSGQGWTEAGGGGAPGGSSTQIQYNNSGSFEGATDGLTNGSHFAFGPTAAIDGDQNFFWGTNSTVATIKTTNTDANGANAIYAEVNYNPTADADDGGYAPLALGAQVNLNLDGQGTTDMTEVSAIACHVVNTSDTVPISNMTGAYVAVSNDGNANTDHLWGIQTVASHTGNGTIGVEQIGVISSFPNSGNGAVNSQTHFYADISTFDIPSGTYTVGGHNDFFAGGGPIITSGSGTLNVTQDSRINCGATTSLANINIVTRYGIFIGSQAGATTNYQLYSDGTAQSLFKGPISLPYTQAQVVYSAAGTPLPSAATAGVGARAFVSDANSTTFAAAYVSGGSNKVPVYSDGSAWHIG